MKLAQKYRKGEISQKGGKRRETPSIDDFHATGKNYVEDHLKKENGRDPARKQGGKMITECEKMEVVKTEKSANKTKTRRLPSIQGSIRN